MSSTSFEAQSPPPRPTAGAIPVSNANDVSPSSGGAAGGGASSSALVVGGGDSSTATALLRHSIDAEREARRERRARIERSVQAALFEQRTQHTNAVSGLKTQLLELKHQDDIATLKHHAKARESTLEQEINNLHKLLEDERNKRAFSDMNAARALEAQQKEADKRALAEQRLLEEQSRKTSADAEAMAAFEQQLNQLQQALKNAKLEKIALEKEVRDRSMANAAERAAEEEEKSREAAQAMLSLRTEMEAAAEKQRREAQQQLTKAVEAERKLASEKEEALEQEMEALQKVIESEKQARATDAVAHHAKEKSSVEAKERDFKAREQALKEAMEADKQAAMDAVEERLQEEREAREREKQSAAKAIEALNEKHARRLKDLESSTQETEDAVAKLEAELATACSQRDAALGADKTLRDRASSAEARIISLKGQCEQLEKQVKAMEESLAAAEAEKEEEAQRASAKLSDAERRHKEAIAQLNKKVREARAAAKEAEDKAEEWDRALKEANDRVDADTKALDLKYAALVAAHQREQQNSKEQLQQAEEAHARARESLEEALASEKEAHNATKQQLVKAEEQFTAKKAAMAREHAEGLQQAKLLSDNTIRRLEEELEEERRKRRDLAQQKEALSEGFEELSKEYDAAVASMETLETQLHDNRLLHEQAMAALTREMERSRTNRSHSVAAADAAEAEVSALKAELSLVKRKLKRNICAKCGGSGFGASNSTASPSAAPAAPVRDESVTQNVSSGGLSVSNLNNHSAYYASQSIPGGGIRRLSVGEMTPTPTNGSRRWADDDDDDIDGKRYGASGDF